MKNLKTLSIFVVTAFLILFSCNDGANTPENTTSTTKTEIIYQFLEYQKMEPEIASLSNGKIVVGKNRLAFDGQKVDDVYKIRDNKLCVYNPETDSDDCYEFKRDLSTCNLESFFKIMG